MRKNTVVSLACTTIAAVALVLVTVAPTVKAQSGTRKIVLFTQTDQTLEFHLDFDGPISPTSAPIGGHGVEAGTVSGAIEGTTLTAFKFRGLSLDNRVGIADTDGDRIIFHKLGTGTFLPPLNDPSAAPNFQVFGQTGTTIVLTGTYQVVATTGKYVGLYRLGEVFPFDSIATNPSWPPATSPAVGSIVPGTEYVKVYSNRN